MTPLTTTATAGLLLIAVATAAAAATAAPAAVAAAAAAAPPCPTAPTLVCTLTPASGSDAAGNVTLTPTTAPGSGACTTAASAVVTGLVPGSVHGWHIHEFGDVSAADGTATGGHYNPAGVPHALPGEGVVRHVGDLGNLLPADAAGVAVTPSGLTFDLVATPQVVGRGVIIHAKLDDGGQPTGNAGARIAQCVLGVGRPAPPPVLPVVILPAEGGAPNGTYLPPMVVTPEGRAPNGTSLPPVVVTPVGRAPNGTYLPPVVVTPVPVVAADDTKTTASEYAYY